MTAFETPKTPSDLHDLLVRLWSKAQDGPDYQKGEWLALQHSVWGLIGWTPSELEEPPRWNGNGDAGTVPASD